MQRTIENKGTAMRATAISLEAISISRDAAAQPVTESRLTLASNNVTNVTPDRRKVPAIRLTPRQLEVLALLCEGLPNKLICRQLNISAGTVKAHISGVLRELGVTSRLQAVVLERRMSLLVEPAASAARSADDTGADTGGCGAEDTATAIDFVQRRAAGRFGSTHPGS